MLSEKEHPEQAKKEYDWRPTTTDDYVVPSFNIPISSAPGSEPKRREMLSKVYAFINYIKHIRVKDTCTIIPIPTTNKRLISICGDKMGVSRLIQYMKVIGLISVYDDNYQFNAFHAEDNKSKTYKYYFENEIKVIEYCKANNIQEKMIINHYQSKSLPSLDYFDNDKVLFSSNLYLLKPENYSKSMFEEYISEVLHRNYPLLE